MKLFSRTNGRSLPHKYVYNMEPRKGKHESVHTSVPLTLGFKL